MDGPSNIGVDSPAAPRLPASAARLALIERDAAWKLASQAIGHARAGTGSALLYEGASGLGKSGLLAAIRALAEESGAQTLAAAGHRREAEFPFGVALQLFESEASGDKSLLRQDLLAAPPRASPFSEIHGLYRACAELAAAAPVVLLIDDADLSDDESLRFLLYLTERVSQLPIALVLSAGTVPSRRAPSLLAEIARHPCTLRSRLEPLSAGGTARRVEKTTLSASAQEAAEEIHRASGGNPFVVDALANALGAAEDDRAEKEAPAARAAGLASPGVAEWALVRAADIDEEAPALLKAIAVLGDDCSVRDACALAGRHPETAGDIIDALTEVGILAPGERLSFAQPAVGAAIESAQTPNERAASNLRAARVLAYDGQPAERVADHLLLATRMGSAATVDRLSLAASVSLGRADGFAAVRYLRRALDEPPPRELRANIVLGLGRAEALTGEPEAALRLADGLAQLTGDARRPREALLAGRTLFALGRPFEALAAFERGLEGGAEIEADTAARLGAARATATWLTGRFNGAEPGLPPAPASGDSAGERALLALHALEGALRGRRATEVRDLAERALGRGALLEDETSDGLAYYLASMALAFAGDLQTAEAALTAAIADAQSRGSVLGFASASHLRARTILKRGRLSDAAHDARRALAVERDGWPFGLGGARIVLAHRLIERGDHAGAQRQLNLVGAASVDPAPFRFSLLSARGRLMLYSGDAEGALYSFMACGEFADRAGIHNPAVVAWRADAGLATAVIGDWSEGERLIESELSLANDFGEPAAIGRALRALGSVLEPERALEALEAAVERLEGSQAALDRATALVDFGAALRRSGRRRDARGPLKAGLELAERCGAEVLSARALREAKVAGARPRRTALHGREALTARERQVAALAAGGKSNREIAEHLFVTVKTVEWHLKNSYIKLGVSSRTELRAKLGDEEPA